MPVCMICNQPMQVLFNVSYFCPPCENSNKPASDSKWKPIKDGNKDTGWVCQYLEGAVSVPEDATHGWWISPSYSEYEAIEHMVVTGILTRGTMWEITSKMVPDNRLLSSDDKLLVFKRRIITP